MAEKFKLGSTVVTKGIDDRMNEEPAFRHFVMDCLMKYIIGDWGDTCEEDSKSNEDAIENGERILAVYIYKKTGEKIRIITEWDRSVTTILFPSEY